MANKTFLHSMCTWDKIRNGILNNMFVTLPFILSNIALIVLALLGLAIVNGIIVSLIIYPQYDIHTGCLNDFPNSADILNSSITLICNNSATCYLNDKHGIISGCGLVGTISILTIAYLVALVRTLVRIYFRVKMLRCSRIPYIDIAKKLAIFDAPEHNDEDNPHRFAISPPNYMQYDMVDQFVLLLIVLAMVFIIIWLIFVSVGILLTLVIYGWSHNIKNDPELFCNLASNLNIFGKCFVVGLIPASIIAASILIVMGWGKMEKYRLIDRLYSNYEINHLG